MKSYKHFYHEIYAFPRLLQAAEKARQGKRQKAYVARFHLNLEAELLRLESELKAMIYTPGGYKEFFIVEPKVRLISAAPYRDRVVHHALIQAIEPLLDPTFIYDTYACRAGKGTHLIKKLRGFQNRYRQGEMTWESISQSVYSWIAHASHADTWRLREDIFAAAVFRRERGHVVVDEL